MNAALAGGVWMMPAHTVCYYTSPVPRLHYTAAAAAAADSAIARDSGTATRCRKTSQPLHSTFCSTRIGALTLLVGRQEDIRLAWLYVWSETQTCIWTG